MYFFQLPVLLSFFFCLKYFFFLRLSFSNKFRSDFIHPLATTSPSYKGGMKGGASKELSQLLLLLHPSYRSHQQTLFHIYICVYIFLYLCVYTQPVLQIAVKTSNTEQFSFPTFNIQTRYVYMHNYIATFILLLIYY